MAAQAAVVLTDAEGTPVARSFGPNGTRQDGAAEWLYTAGGVLVGYNTLTQLVRGPTQQSDVTKVTHELQYPILETVSTTGTSAGYTAASKVAYTLRARIEWFLPGRSSQQERKNLQAMINDLTQENVLKDAVWNRERAW